MTTECSTCSKPSTLREKFQRIEHHFCDAHPLLATILGAAIGFGLVEAILRHL